MVRTANAKYGYWLAGFYEDFIGSRCLADDGNVPTADGAYDDTNTHHGNTMNGEATLNPRFRWSVRDRTTSGEWTDSTNYLLVNGGVSRWATYDATRLGKGGNWAGMSQLQFPSSLAHPNRLRYDKAGVSNSDPAYMTFSSGFDSSLRFYVPGGDTDATHGRDNHYAFNGRNFYAGISGSLPTLDQPDFMQTAHLTGVWTGERLNLKAQDGTTGNDDPTHFDYPERLFRQIRSKAGKPFLCVRTYMNEADDHRLNNVAPSGDDRPVIHFDSNLNTRNDGDVFGIRMAVHSHNGNPAIPPVPGRETGIDTSVPVEYTLRVGFPSNTVFDPTTGSSGATPAIEWVFRPDDGHGLSATAPYYHMEFDASLSQPEQEPWFDLDFVVDYTAGTFKVYHDGTEVTATNDGAGAYSSGYALGGSIPADAMTGWEMFVTNYNAASVVENKRAIITTMIDRVAVYRPLTDQLDNTNPSAVGEWSCDYPVNGVSNAKIRVYDDQTEQELSPIFLNDSLNDWRLLFFNGNIHRPLWSGIIENVSVTQAADKRTRELVLEARDSLSLLDRQIAAWEIGQIGSGESDVVLARRDEVSLLSDAMFFGTRRLEQRQPSLGFEADFYDEQQNQRLAIGSGHPVQFYNDEDTDGPNNSEREWLGYRIIGFDKSTGGAVEAVINGDLPTATQVGDTITVYGSDNYDGDYTLGVGETSQTGNSIGGVPSSYDTQELPGATWVANTTQSIVEISGGGVAPTYAPTAPLGTIHFTYQSLPTHADGTALKVGDRIIITSHEYATATPTPLAKGFFRVVGITPKNGYYIVKTDRTSTSTTKQTTAFNYALDRGYLSPTDEGLTYRNAHAVWMRDLPKSAWFKKHFGIFDFAIDNSDTLQSACTTSSNSLHVTSSSVWPAEVPGVGQIIDSDGFIDTFTYLNVILAGDGNTYFIGVSGLSRDHSSGATVVTLTTSNDYKHLWLLWSDMRNNGDADADGGTRKNSFGLMQPIGENYDLNLMFTDQWNDDGSYQTFTDLKVGSDVDLWDIDAEVDPSTGIPWSKPLGTAGAELISTSGVVVDEVTVVGPYTGKASITVHATFVSDSSLVAGDQIAITNSQNYNGVHTAAYVASSGPTRTIILDTDHTVDEPWGGYGGGPYIFNVLDDYRLSDLEAWESKGGSFLVVDASPFFNLNTFSNGGTYGQISGGRVSLGDYETEYHGFPVLMDSYWSEAAARPSTISQPYGNHANYLKWNANTAELNRSILLGDTVIETKESVSLIADFPPEGYGKIRATRSKTSTNPSKEVLYYTYDGKFDAGLTEQATSAASGSGLTITCSAATFQTDGVLPGMRVRNNTAKWVAQIASVPSETEIVIVGTPYQETGSTRTDVANLDSITIPQQLYGVYVEPEGGRNWTPQQAEEHFYGILLDSTVKSNGATVKVELSANNANTAGTFDEVIITASVSPRYALRFLMHIDGFVEAPNMGTYYMNDKVRFMWSLMLADTWLTQASAPCWFDFSTVPQSQGMTIDGTNSNADSFGSTNDARGGKTLLSILRESNESVGVGSSGLELRSTYQMGRDNALEVRPAYNCGEAVTRDNLHISNLKASMGGQISNVRVYYNNGASFADYPEASLGSTYRWKVVELPEITNYNEAYFMAREQYRQSKTKSVNVTGELIRDLDDDDKMLGGRYGYVADVTREMERGAAQDAIFSGGTLPSNGYNGTWCGAAGNLFPGMVNALDGNLGTDGTDAYLRTRYGKAYYTQDTASSATEPHNENFWWWGANSLAHAVQIVHVPTGTPLVSDATGNDLRIWVALKDGQTGTDIDSAVFLVGISDLEFDDSPQSPFVNKTGGTSQFSPSKSATLATNGYESVEVSRNGYYEVDVPASYGAPAGAKFVISVNADYLREVLRHRCGDPSGSGILHNAHDIDEVGPSSWTSTNADSLFPLGMRKFDYMSGGYDTRAAWYAPRIHVVEDVRWRPATQVTYTDSGLGLSAEPMVISRLSWSVKGRDVENLTLTLERDQTKDAGGLSSYLFPRTARRRGEGVGSSGAGSGTGSETPQTPPVAPGAGRVGGGYIPVGGGLGRSGVTPSISEGGRPPLGIGSGGFTKNLGSNALSGSLNNSLRGRLDLGENGLSSSSFSILGQNRTVAPVNQQRSLDSLDTSIAAASAGATATAEGWVFPGIVNPEVSDRFTHTQTITMRVPDDVSDQIVTLGGTYSLGGSETDTAVLTVTISCDETGASESKTITLSGAAERKTLFMFGSPIDGMETGGNNVTVEVKRTPASGDDTADYSSLVLHNIRVNFQRFSLPGRGNANVFSPY